MYKCLKELHEAWLQKNIKVQRYELEKQNDSFWFFENLDIGLEILYASLKKYLHNGCKMLKKNK